MHWYSSLLYRRVDVVVLCHKLYQSLGKWREEDITFHIQQWYFSEMYNVSCNFLFWRENCFGYLPACWYRSFLQTTISAKQPQAHILYTVYGIQFGPGADPDLAFPSLPSMLVLRSKSPSLVRWQVVQCVYILPKGCLFVRRRVSVGDDSMSSILQSGLPNFSSSSNDLVNLNGFAVKGDLIFDFAFLFFLMFSAFVMFVRCCLSMSLKCWRPIFSMLDVVLLYYFRRTLSRCRISFICRWSLFGCGIDCFSIQFFSSNPKRSWLTV